MRWTARLGSHKFNLAARVILAAVFLVASHDKLMNPGGFAGVVENYRILPAYLVNPAAVFLPWLELLVGLALLAGVLARGAGLLALLLMVAFTLALGFNLLRGLDVACGCFRVGAGSDPANLFTLLRDFLFVLLASAVLYGLRANMKQRSPERNS